MEFKLPADAEITEIRISNPWIYRRTIETPFIRIHDLNDPVNLILFGVLQVAGANFTSHLINACIQAMQGIRPGSQAATSA
jgi:hypothetical protein